MHFVTVYRPLSSHLQIQISLVFVFCHQVISLQMVYHIHGEGMTFDELNSLPPIRNSLWYT